jgi:hypothetical protein
VSRRQMQRTGRASLTRPTCYSRTLAQVIEVGTAYQRLRLRHAINRLLSRIPHVRHGGGDRPGGSGIALEVPGETATPADPGSIYVPDMYRRVSYARTKAIMVNTHVN